MKRIRVLLIVGAIAAAALGVAGLAAAQDEEAAPTPFFGITFDAADEGAVVIDVVSDSPAEAAGIQSGDIITAIGETAITAETLRDTVLGYAVGDTASVTLLRDGEEQTVEVTFAETPADITIRRGPGFQFRDDRGGRGQGDQPRFEFRYGPGDGPMFELFSAQRPILGVTVTDGEGGALVADVLEGSAAEAAGLQADDVITAINGEETADARAVIEAVRSAWQDAEVGTVEIAVTVTRAGETVELTASVEKTEAVMVPNLEELMPMMPEMFGRRGFGFGHGMMIVPNEAGDGFEFRVPFTPADPAALTPEATAALEALGLRLVEREDEPGVYDLFVPTDAIQLDGFDFTIPGMEGTLPVPAEPATEDASA
ncbi:MAG: PDZ domain-containing protein [Chloroflexi bacterium]|nr:PDZ domain-containing protein [Chloroflexota bacterium]